MFSLLSYSLMKRDYRVVLAVALSSEIIHSDGRTQINAEQPVNLVIQSGNYIQGYTIIF